MRSKTSKIITHQQGKRLDTKNHMKNNNIISFVLLGLLFTFAQNVQSQNSNVSVRPISKLLDSLYLSEKYPELLKVVDNVINIKKSKNDIYNLDYTEMLMKKASSLYRLEKPGAADVCKEATLIVSKLIGKYNETYKSYVKSLATYCYAEDKYPDCIIYENKALDIENKLNIPLDFERLSIMCEGKSDRELGVSNIHLLGRSTFDIFGSIIQGQNKEYNNLVTENKNYENSKKAINKVSLLRGKRESSDEIDYLPGTLEEAQNIVKCFTTNNNIGKANLITGKKATETSLKALSGSKIKVMHIGTHGFYEVESEDQRTITFYSDINYSEEDKALLRSGLLFAVAQNFFDGTKLPDDVEDGILTSQEISYLDFYGLDLITLSACQTAQGDITSDGVFGLQRGFKKAGAKSILMSLCKVDDKATNKLMTEFYSDWISKNMSKYDALEAAKRTVRNTKGCEDSKYWAAFILLDGLN